MGLTIDESLIITYPGVQLEISFPGVSNAVCAETKEW